MLVGGCSLKTPCPVTVVAPRYGSSSAEVNVTASNATSNLFNYWLNVSSDLPGAQEYLNASGTDLNLNWHRFLSVAQLEQSFNLTDKIPRALASNQGELLQ